MMARVIVEKDRATAKATAYQRQYSKNITELREKLLRQDLLVKEQKKQQESERRILSKLMEHFEAELGELSAQHVRSRLPQAASLSGVLMQQELNRQQADISSLEWQVDQRVEQMRNMREDQQAALATVRRDFKGTLVMREAEWARERKRLLGDLDLLRQKLHEADPTSPGARAGADDGTRSPLAPIKLRGHGTVSAEGFGSTGGGAGAGGSGGAGAGAGAGGGDADSLVEYRPAPRARRGRTRADLKAMRSQLGASQEIYRGGHTLSGRYVVLVIHWRNSGPKRLLVEADEPEVW